MSIMNSYAIEVSTADTVLNPEPTDTAVPTETRKDFLEISFSDNECEPIVSQRDGFQIHYTRNQVNVRVVKRPFRGGWRSFETLCTIATFVRNGSVIGQTVVLPIIENQREADAVLFGTEVRQDEITYI